MKLNMTIHDIQELNLNECSKRTLETIHRMLADKPLGNALVLGNTAVFILPLDSASRPRDYISIVDKRHLCADRFPEMHHIEHLVNHTVDDSKCAEYANLIQTSSFATISHWDRWIIEYFVQMDRIEKIAQLIDIVKGKPAFRINDFIDDFKTNRHKPRIESVAIKDESGKSINVTLRMDDQGICIGFDGHSDFASVDDGGYPIFIEQHEGEVIVRVYADINSEEPTHCINLHHSRNEVRES